MTSKFEKFLKRPDSFQTFFYRIISRFRSQQQKFALLLIGTAVLLIAAVSWTYFRQVQKETRAYEFANVEQIYEKEEKAFFQKKQALQSEISKLQKSDKAKTPETQALLDSKQKEMDALEADHTESLAKYQDFFAAHLKTPEGWRAGMAAVHVLLSKKQLEEAARILSQILPHTLGKDFYQVQVRFMYIEILSDLKKYEEALKEMETLLRVASEDWKPKFLLTKGRIELDFGKKEEAVKSLELLTTNYAGAPEARQAAAMKSL